MQEAVRARSRALFSAGSSMLARIAIMAITMSSSISVKFRYIPPSLFPHRVCPFFLA